MSVLSVFSAVLLLVPAPVPTPAPTHTASASVGSDKGLPRIRLPRRKKKGDTNAPMVVVDRRLRLFVSQQEAWYADKGRYTKDVPGASRRDVLKDAALDQVQIQVLYADRRGWSALASHPAAPGRSCVVFVGSRERLPIVPRTRLEANEAQDEGRPVCDRAR